MIDFELVRLKNGVFSVRSCAELETFHPVIGPAAEAQALYVEQLRLADRMGASADEFVIWDVGLGAAANPVTALRCTSHLQTPVRIISFDRTTAALEFALSHTASLTYLQGFETMLRRLVGEGEVTEGRVHWELRLGDFPTLMRQYANGDTPNHRPIAPANAVFFDAFSPTRNPDMWTLKLLRDMRAQLDAQCSLATYSRSTMARASLLLAGFFVGSGVPLAEKEETTVAATTLDLITHPLAQEWLARAARSHGAEPLHTPVYVQEKLRAETLNALKNHPQFPGDGKRSGGQMA